MQYVEPDPKERIIKLYIQEGRTYKSLSDEYGFSREVITRWVKMYRENAATDAHQAKQLADMEELQKLQKEVEELRKESDFLKKRRRSLPRRANSSIPFSRQVCQALRSQLATAAPWCLSEWVLQLQEASQERRRKAKGFCS